MESGERNAGVGLRMGFFARGHARADALFSTIIAKAAPSLL